MPRQLLPAMAAQRRADARTAFEGRQLFAHALRSVRQLRGTAFAASAKLTTYAILSYGLRSLREQEICMRWLMARQNESVEHKSYLASRVWPCLVREHGLAEQLRARQKRLKHEEKARKRKQQGRRGGSSGGAKDGRRGNDFDSDGDSDQAQARERQQREVDEVLDEQGIERGSIDGDDDGQWRARITSGEGGDASSGAGARGSNQSLDDADMPGFNGNAGSIGRIALQPFVPTSPDRLLQTVPETSDVETEVGSTLTATTMGPSKPSTSIEFQPQLVLDTGSSEPVGVVPLGIEDQAVVPRPPPTVYHKAVHPRASSVNFRASVDKKESIFGLVATNLQSSSGVLVLGNTSSSSHRSGEHDEAQAGSPIRSVQENQHGPRYAYRVLPMATLGAPAAHHMKSSKGLHELLTQAIDRGTQARAHTASKHPWRAARSYREMMTALDMARARADCVVPQAIAGVALAALQLLRMPLDRIRQAMASLVPGRVRAGHALPTAAESIATGSAAASAADVEGDGVSRLDREASVAALHDAWATLLQWRTCGMLLTWSSLLSTFSKESVMVSDAVVGIAAGCRVAIRLVDADRAGGGEDEDAASAERYDTPTPRASASEQKKSSEWDDGRTGAAGEPARASPLGGSQARGAASGLARDSGRRVFSPPQNHYDDSWEDEDSDGLDTDWVAGPSRLPLAQCGRNGDTILRVQSRRVAVRVGPTGRDAEDLPGSVWPHMGGRPGTGGSGADFGAQLLAARNR